MNHELLGSKPPEETRREINSLLKDARIGTLRYMALADTIDLMDAIGGKQHPSKPATSSIIRYEMVRNRIDERSSQIRGYLQAYDELTSHVTQLIGGNIGHAAYVEGNWNETFHFLENVKEAKIKEDKQIKPQAPKK